MNKRMLVSAGLILRPLLYSLSASFNSTLSERREFLVLTIAHAASHRNFFLPGVAVSKFHSAKAAAEKPHDALNLLTTVTKFICHASNNARRAGIKSDDAIIYHV
jgi:hypothetical protein